MVQNLRRRGRRPPPAARRAPALHGAGPQDGGEQGPRARDGEALLQKGGRAVEAGRAPTHGEMERIRVWEIF